MKSIHKFNDFLVSEIKEKICAKLKIDPISCILTNLDYKGHPKLFLDQMRLSNFVDPRSSQYNINIHLHQFSPEELMRQKDQWNYLYIIIERESRDSKDKYKMTNYYYWESENKYSLYSIVNEHTTIAQIYEIVFRKLYSASSLHSLYKDQDLSLKELWEHLKKSQKDKLFFYVKIGDQRVEMED